MNKTMAVTAVSIALLFAFMIPTPSAQNGGQAANKAAVSGSTLEILSAEQTGLPGTDPDEVVVDEDLMLSTTIKTSKPQDLLFHLSLECALWTQLTTVGNDLAQARAQVKVWVEFDGAPVQVSSEDTEDAGRVVFCDRLHEQEVSGLDDEQNLTLRQYLATRTANAFNWVLINAGSGTHTIDVWASLTTDVENQATAQAGIGKRTLVIEPIHLEVDAEL